MRARGYTMVELVVVITLAAVLAAFGASRLLDDSLLRASRFATDAAQRVATAQRLAMAQRKSVYLVLSAAAGTLSLCLDAACTQPLDASPLSQGVLTAPSGVAFTATASAVVFDARGRAGHVSPILVTLTRADGSPLGRVLSIAPDSGHVQILSS